MGSHRDGCDRARRARGAPHLASLLRHPHPTPCPPHRGPATQPQAAETSRVFALTTPGCPAHCASGLPRTPCRTRSLRCQALRGWGGRRRHRRCQPLGSRTARGQSGSTSQRRDGGCRRRPVLAAVSGARELRRGARSVRGGLAARRRPRRQGPRRPRHRWRRGGGCGGAVTGHEALRRRRSTAVGLATVLPPCGGGRHAPTRGGGAASLRLVCRRRGPRLGRLAPTGLARARACSLGRGTPRTRGLGGGVGSRRHAGHSRGAGGPTVGTTGQRGGPGRPTPTAQGRRGVGRVLGHLRDPGRQRRAPARDCLRPSARAQGCGPRRLARALRPLGRHLPPLPPPRLARPTKARHAYRAKGVQMPLAHSTAGPTGRALGSNHGHAGQVARARLGALATRQAPPTLGLQQHTHPQRWSKRRRPTGCLVLGGLETAHIQTRHGIAHEQHPGILRPLRLRALGLRARGLGGPGARRFPTGLAQLQAPRVGLTQDAITGRRYDHLALHQRQPSATIPRLSRTAS